MGRLESEPAVRVAEAGDEIPGQLMWLLTPTLHGWGCVLVEPLATGYRCLELSQPPPCFSFLPYCYIGSLSLNLLVCRV